ncbi:SecY interacting protein Syd [Catenovulum agarivorans DS-2]|uniref:SecY interacting protein Syd n=1 Tax=Catenovulum agarivorans DS-2 TaxID=1328313 RepID=W7QW12_9ALTE|nr:SecY-interacting protein [Catenovulum agarivorans]EWH11928.1 SecY interacting protein Syd [Catenovulum agarivorans DS-2]
MSVQIDDALKQFFTLKQDNQQWVEYDCEWTSPCVNKVDEAQGLCSWQPIQREQSVNLDNINQALSLELHPDVVAFYCSFFAPTLDAEFAGNQLNLIQAWNAQDFTILQENIIGHLLMKQKLKQAPTVFIAATDDDQYIISVDNQTGAVMLEMVGRNPQRQLADSLASFILQLS